MYAYCVPWVNQLPAWLIIKSNIQHFFLVISVFNLIADRINLCCTLMQQTSDQQVIKST